MELKSDLSNVKVGDRVFCTLYGWGTISNIKKDADHPIKVNFINGNYASYRLDGKLAIVAELPSLFTYNPFESKEFEPEAFEPRWMMVSDKEINWNKRYVIGKITKYLAYNGAETDEELKDLDDSNDLHTVTWNYAKEIEEFEISIEEAIEELAKLKGVDKSLIKIKL